jgi:hypothetical protein
MKIPSRRNAQAPPYTKDAFRLPKVLEIMLGLVVLLELLAPFVTKAYGIDARFHLLWIDQFSKLNSEGVIIPTWAPTAFYGFGGTSFYFYPPFTFYFASIIHFLTGIHDPLVLYQAVSLIATIASFFAIRPLLRTIGSSGYRLNLAAALYAFAPLRIAELYSRSSLSTHVTYIILPFIWYALIAVIRTEGTFRTRRILRLALWCACLALTNVPITLMTGICICIAGIAIRKKITWSALAEIVLALGIAAMLAFYHYASVLSAQPFARLQDLNFLHRPSDIMLYFHFGPGAYQLLLLYGVACLLAGTYVWFRWKKKLVNETEDLILQIGLSIAAFVLFLDFFPFSSSAWNTLKPLQLIQFPWRFYPQLLLFGVLIVGTARSKAMVFVAKSISGLWIVGAILPAILVVFNLHFFAHFESPVTDATEFLPIFFNPSNVSNGVDIKTSLDRSLQPHASDPWVFGDFSVGEKIERTNAEPYYEAFNATLRTPHTVTFHRFYWPFWHLYANGNEITSHPDSLGRATAMLPAGAYPAVWHLEHTPLERAGLWISGLTIIGIILLAIIGYFRIRVRMEAE